MSLHKLNTFHWHFTDDQGWRFESKKYPKLTEIGSIRIEKDGTKYGPFFYTQNDMKSIVSFAKTLCITVIPVIEMPGHSRAVIASYPEFSCGIKPPKPVPNTWKIFKSHFCLGNSATIQFSKDILDEVLEIFDSEFIQIGAEQVRPSYWLKCPKCQKIWKEEKIKTSMEYLCWFSKQIAEFINQKGRIMIGGDEILDESLPKNNIIINNISAEKGKKAANSGYKVVLAFSNLFYFDYSQFNSYDGHKYMGSISTLSDIYEFDPYNNIDNKESVLGFRANVWSEYIDNFIDLQWKVFPRLCAVSEVAWSRTEEKDFTLFSEKLESKHLDRLRELGIKYAHQ